MRRVNTQKKRAFTWALECGFLGKTSSEKKKEQRDDIADVLDDGGNRDDESLFTNYHQH